MKKTRKPVHADRHNPRRYGVRNVLKQYHEVLLLIIEELGQTRREAAHHLGISVSTLQKYIRLQGVPNLRTERGKLFGDRFRIWSQGFEAIDTFPEAYFTEKFLEAPKTYVLNIPFRLMFKSGNHVLMLPQGKAQAVYPSKKS